MNIWQVYYVYYIVIYVINDLYISMTQLNVASLDCRLSTKEKIRWSSCTGTTKGSVTGTLGPHVPQNKGIAGWIYWKKKQRAA